MSDEQRNSYNEPKMKRICSECGCFYSKIITENCPVCTLRKEIR